jgi:hypothetical protein
VIGHWAIVLVTAAWGRVWGIRSAIPCVPAGDRVIGFGRSVAGRRGSAVRSERSDDSLALAPVPAARARTVGRASVRRIGTSRPSYSRFSATRVLRASSGSTSPMPARSSSSSSTGQWPTSRGGAPCWSSPPSVHGDSQKIAAAPRFSPPSP